MADTDIAPELDDAEDAEPESAEPFDRSRDLLGRANSPIRKRLDDIFTSISNGFQAQADRSDALDDWWDCFNCVLNANQYYKGNAGIYVPIIRDAINARVTRFSNQLFPPSGRCVEVTSSDGTQPSEIIALVETYIRARKLKTMIVKPLLRNGDIEGQYNLYVSWDEIQRQIVSRETHGPVVPMDGEDVETEGDEIDDVSTEDIAEGSPFFEALHDSDVLVMPATADTIEEALSQGGSATIVRRWSKEKLDAMVDAGELRKEAVDDLQPIAGDTIERLSDIERALVRSIGIRVTGKFYMVLETWAMLPLNKSGMYDKKGDMRLCRAWYGLDRMPLGCKRNPNWNDRCPLLSAPVEKIAGVFKGKSLIEAVAPLQYEANDAANECADVDHYGAMPIIARKPGVSTAPLILNLAAIWDVGPDDVKFLEFPDLSGRAVARIQRATTAIFQSLSVNPSMMPQTTGTSKTNQARIAQEQQVDLLTTAESVAVAEESVLTPLVDWVVDLDYQHRRRDLTVRAYGEMGVRAEMIDVPPLQNRTRYAFVWSGAQQARNAAMFQSQLAWINVARGMIQDLKAQGIRLNVAPVLEQSAQPLFGPRTAPLVLVDMRRELTIPPDLENDLLVEGHDLYVHPMDPDPEHLPSHQRAALETGDPHGVFRVHIARHVQSMQIKMASAIQQQIQQQGAQGVPGGAGPGVAGAPRGGAPPRMGAQPAKPQLVKGPPGSIHPDQMPRAGAPVMPRRM